MPQKLTAYLMGAVLALMSGWAAARDYEIEIIVFDRLDKEVNAHEQWDFSSARITERLRRMDELAGKASELPTSDSIYRLAEVQTNLLESGYRILDTTRWQQPPSFYQNAPLIPLGDTGGALASGFVRIYTTSLIYADLDLHLAPFVPGLVPALGDFDSGFGEADLDVDLGFDVDVNADVDAEVRQPHYFIAEKRRLKFKQIHYFDHPLFGAILGVWPTAAAEPQP